VSLIGARSFCRPASRRPRNLRRWFTITTAYGKPAEGSPVLPRNQYVEIQQEKPQNKYQQAAPEYKPCKHTIEAIIAEGTGKGQLRKVCADPNCPIHHPKKHQSKADAAFKAGQEKRRREEAIANATGLRVLAAISKAVPVRLMKRDLLFVVERLAAMLDERKLAVFLRGHGIGKTKDADTPARLLASFLPKADESTLGRLLLETVILLSSRSQQEAAKVLRDAAERYKVNVDAISASIRQEFTAKEKTKPKPIKKMAAA
jgi:ParB family chromosome partitioning protein